MKNKTALIYYFVISSLWAFTGYQYGKISSTRKYNKQLQELNNRVDSSLDKLNSDLKALQNIEYRS